jgi:hypothetical protein
MAALGLADGRRREEDKKGDVRMKSTPVMARLMSKVVILETGCWEFKGSRQARGHGLIRIGSKKDGTARLAKAHRVVYEHLIGAIPEGLALDHLCSNPSCVNPEHLEPVTRGENVRREADRRTKCRRGHPWVIENLTVVGSGYRTCATCLAETRARANAKRRARRAVGEVPMR